VEVKSNIITQTWYDQDGRQMSSMTWRYLCLPNNRDPRGPKGSRPATVDPREANENGPTALEVKLQQDWYACYADAEKTVPSISVQASGDYGYMSVIAAAKLREKQVQDLAHACMRARGYTSSSGESTTPQPLSGSGTVGTGESKSR